MPDFSVLLLAACMFLGAALYTSVGHAGASAYLALMALFGIAPAVMRPTALALNILVASFTSAVEGRERYIVGIRYPRDYRSDPQALIAGIILSMTPVRTC
jgi:hypothetical protein